LIVKNAFKVNDLLKEILYLIQPIKRVHNIA